jgi:flagellar biosynthesis GTPase FlhF
MTSSVFHWEEDWFSVGTEEKGKEEVGKEEKEREKEKKEQERKEQEKKEQEKKEKERREKERREKEEQERKEKEEQKAWKSHMEALLQKQSERVAHLEREVLLLREQLQNAPQKAVTDVLEEWKQIKERELNYALRRRQPVPFFPLESMMRWERAIHPVGSAPLPRSSPLFRHQTMRKEREQEEKEIEALIRGMDAIQL